MCLNEQTKETMEEQLKNELEIKNKIVGKHLLDNISSLIRLIADYHLPYKINLELDPDSRFISEEYLSNHHRN